MTIVVTSQIQHRRGLRSDLPVQLSEGELGWCLDTRQLFIGNSDGFGDNTEIITQFSQDVLSNVNVLATNTTFARVLADRFADVFNVKDFGATGVFAQDATGAVQAAVNAALAADRATVYFPSGQYKVGAITIGPNITIVGDGTGVSEVYARDSGQDIFTYTETTVTNTNINISQLSFISQNPGAGTAVYISGTDAAIRVVYIRITDCEFGLLNKAVHLRFAANIWLNNLQAQSCTTPYYIDTCGDVNFNSCHAQNGTGYGYTLIQSESPRGPSSEGQRLINCESNGQKGIYANEIHWANVIGGSFTSGFPSGTAPTPTSDPMVDLVNCANWRFQGTDISFAGTGGYWGPGLHTDSDCERIQLTGCFVALNTYAANINGRWNTVTGCVFSPNGTRDIDVKGKYTTITGNTCASNVTPNITETASADYNNFVGNICNNGLITTGANTIVGTNITSHPNT